MLQDDRQAVLQQVQQALQLGELRAGGLDPNEWSGFAFGFGIDRMAKERHGVNDIRDMYSDDIRFTEQFS
jgi:hypothetical protein